MTTKDEIDKIKIELQKRAAELGFPDVDYNPGIITKTQGLDFSRDKKDKEKDRTKDNWLTKKVKQGE